MLKIQAIKSENTYYLHKHTAYTQIGHITAQKARSKIQDQYHTLHYLTTMGYNKKLMTKRWF